MTRPNSVVTSLNILRGGVLTLLGLLGWLRIVSSMAWLVSYPLQLPVKCITYLVFTSLDRQDGFHPCEILAIDHTY